ncbi:MAG: glutathione S-transferase C-terminal domain-containing protein [Nitrosospira sp.]
MLDIDALSACLGEKKYFLGDQPTTLDATAFGFLINTLGCPIESPLKEHGLSKNNLKNYVARIRAEYYPELR